MENFQSGLKIVWDSFLNGKEMDHVHAVDNSGEERPRGTMEAELVARETKRKDTKRRRLMNGDEL